MDRLLPVSTTPGAVTGNNYMDAVQDEVTGLCDRAIFQLTSVTGTNTITASVEVPLTAGLVDGMRFVLVPVATTTVTNPTLNVQSTGAKAIVDNLGGAPRVGALQVNGKYLLEYNLGDDKYYLLTYIPPSGFDDRPSFRNVMGDNGHCLIWQRGSTVSVAASTTAYTLDRWYITTGANQASTITRLSFGDASQYCANVQRNSGQTGTGVMVFAYPLTTDEVIRLRGAKASLQFRVSNGANWSPASGTLNYNFYVGTGTEGKRGAGFTSETTVISGSVNLSGGTSTVTATSAAAVPSGATQGELRFTWTPVGTAGANDSFLFDKVQLEMADAATGFEFVPFGYALQRCQRHYAKTFAYATAPAQNAGLINALSGDKDLGGLISVLRVAQGGNPGAAVTTDFTAAEYGTTGHWRFPVRMRVTPTITTFNPSAANANWRLPSGNDNAAIDSTVTVSPHSSTGDAGVTLVGAGVSVEGAVATQTEDKVAYIHITASAEL